MAAKGLDAVFQHLRRAVLLREGSGITDDILLESFVNNRDGAAFEALVRRHGRMVMSVCRRILGDFHQAEDSFQGTFHVLAQCRFDPQAERTGALALCGSSTRVHARSGKASAQQNLERRLANKAPIATIDDTAWQDLSSVLDEEIGRLPQKYSAPLILSYLESKSRSHVAKELGWPEGTVARRLERGRELLRLRLVKRGVTLSAGALGVVLVEKVGAAPIPAMLAINTIKAATTVAAGQAAGGGFISAQALLLAEETMNGMLLVKAKSVLIVLTVSVALGGASWAGYKEFLAAPQQEQKAKAQPAPAVAAPTAVAEKKEQLTDIYGDPLPAGAVARLGTMRYRPGSALSASALSRNGKFLAGAGGNVIQIWDAETGKTLQRIAGFPVGVVALAFTSDSKLVASAAFESRLPNKRQFPTKFQIHEVVTGKTVKQLDLKLRDQDNAKADDEEDFLEKGFNSAASLFFLAILPGGQEFLLHSGGPIMRLFDATSGEETRSFRHLDHELKSAALSSDGKTLALVEGGETVRISPTGRIIGGVEGAGTVRLWNIATGKEIIAITKHAVPKGKKDAFQLFQDVSVVFAPDDKVLATGSEKEGIFFWDVATGKQLLVSEARDANAPGSIVSLSFAADGKTLVSSHRKSTIAFDGKITVSTYRNTLVLWDSSTGKEIRRLDQPHLSGPTPSSNGKWKAVFLPDGKTIFVSGSVNPGGVGESFLVNASTFSFVDAETGEPRRHFEGHLNPVGQLYFSHDGLLIATAEEGSSGKVRVWEPGSGRLVFKVGDNRGLDSAVLAFSFKENWLAVPKPGEIELWNAKTGEVAQTITSEKKLPFALAFTADGTKLLTCDRGQTIRIRDLASGKELRTIHAGENDGQNEKADGFFAVAFAPDLSLAAIADQGQSTIHIWDLATGKEFKHFKRGGGGAIGLLFSSDGRTLLETTGSKIFCLWEIATGEQRRIVSIPVPAFGTSVAFSPDNRLIALGGRLGIFPKKGALSNDINIYDVSATRFISTLNGHEGAINTLSFSPDGRFLASGSRDMTGLVWKVAGLAAAGPTNPLTANERAVCWTNLAGNAQDAYASIWKLIADKESVDLLRDNLKPAVALAGSKEIQKPVGELSSEQLATRSQANNELAKFGLAAEVELRKALIPGLTLETQRRVEKLLAAIKSDELRSVRAIEVLESINSPAARQLLETLSKGRADAWQTREAKTSLKRLEQRAPKVP